MEIFNPSRQVDLCEKHLDDCFAHDFPTLRGLSQMYDEVITKSWIEILIKDLMEYAGVKEKMSLSQIDNLANIIRVEFFYLKFSELMIFFHWFKAGRYGKFYGVVDGLVITEALHDFMDDRREKMRQIEQKRKEMITRTEQAERQEMEQRGLLLARDEWDEISWLFNM